MWGVHLPWPEVRSYREAEFTRLERMLGGRTMQPIVDREVELYPKGKVGD